MDNSKNKINEIITEIIRMRKLAFNMESTDPAATQRRYGYITAYNNCLKAIEKASKGYVGKYFMTNPEDVGGWNDE